MNLIEAHNGFRRFFPGIRFNVCMDRLLTLITREAKISPVLFDVYLHEKHGEYEERGLSMEGLLEKEYGREAKDFIERLL